MFRVLDPGPVRLSASSPLSLPRWLLLPAVALTFAACGTAGDYAPTDPESEGKASGTAYADVASAGDAYASGGRASDASSTTGGGTQGPSDNDQGIGLKPGGAQDISFFRMKLAAKQLPKPGDMTMEGWLNEHDTVLPKADPNRSIDLHAMAGVLVPKSGANPEVVVQLGFNSGKSLAEVKAKVALTLIIDRSGSMLGGKLSYVKAGLEALLGALPEGTRLSIVSFSSDVRTDWAPKDWVASDLNAVTGAIAKIEANGGTNIYDGLKSGLGHCFASGNKYAFRRVILLSDGQATEGNTSSSAIIGLAKGGANEGCSVSSVGVGYDFDPGLMNGIAQQGNGTAWFLQDAAQAKKVFISDLETMLLPVAEKLWIKVKLAAGWKVDQIYGFDWVEKNGEVTVLGPKGSEPPTEEPGPTEPDGGSTGSDPNAPKTALPTLFASKKNGLVMMRLLPPANAQVQLKDLLLATVQYGYTLAKEKKNESFEVPVQVSDLVAVPDGGLQYFPSPIVRRSFALVEVGRALIKAALLADQGDSTAAMTELADAIVALAAQTAAFSPEELKVFDKEAPDLPDAAQILADLKAVLQGPSS